MKENKDHAGENEIVLVKKMMMMMNESKCEL